jgi:hypothetical protein
MIRFIITLGLVLGLGSSTAVADDDDYRLAGRRGTVTAYELDTTRVIGHSTCAPATRFSWRYSDCGARLRERMKIRLCAKLGKGAHRYHYQIGNNRPSKATVYCRN